MRELDFTSDERVAPLRAAMAAKRHGRVRSALHSFLRRRRSDFDVNAMLGMYPMTYLDTTEWRTVLPDAHGALLDVGAGDGELTRSLAPLFSSVTCTETSRGMAKKLRRAGFAVHDGDLVDRALTDRFDAIALLHVLDRCARPLSLIDAALGSARPGALVMVAIPIPFRPHVDVGKRTERPSEWLVPEEATDEEAVVEIERVLGEKLDLSARAIVPYLCPGDSRVPYYELRSRLWVGRALIEP
jgi:SAM-dependent methyltransferase